ncbi:MAG TPA: phosphohistidine phosphatase SixA [Terriglobia bacterium]|nr:phosphohistidine phosphatase SixA [Terriglobia bacterium]
MPEAEDNTYEICIMRHGLAADRSTGQEDSRRPLTPEGKERMQKIAAGLLKTGFAPALILSSPYVRAMETAKIVAEAITPAPPLDRCEALQPGATPEDLVAFLARHPEHKRVLLVGHEPDLSALAARLTGAARQARFGFKKGGCCLIEFDGFPLRPPGQLIWWLTPRLLRKLP